MKLDKVMNTITSNISEAWKAQVGCLQDLESDSYDMKEKEVTW